MQGKHLLFIKSDVLTKNIYRLTFKFPNKYQSSIGDQLRRASLSVVLNIVEGGAYFISNERNRYLRISYASLKESKYLIYFANDLGLLSSQIYNKLMEEINQLAGIIYGLIIKNKRKI